MTNPLQKHPLRTLIVLLIPALVAVVYLIIVARYSWNANDGYAGALLDDTWIHVRFAESISKGDGLMYNAGEVTPGATSPLWVLILGAIYAITTPGIDAQVETAIVLSAFWHVATVLVITGFGSWVTRRAWVGLLAGLLTAFTGRYVWMGLSGMETTAFTALSIAALWSHVDDMRGKRVFGWRTGTLAALATLARPEGYLLAALIGFDAFMLVPLRDWIFGAAWWQRVKVGWRGILSYGMLAGTYPFASWLMTGHWLPNTFRAKSQLGEQFPDFPQTYFWTPRADHGWVVIAFAGIGLVMLLWREWTRRDHAGAAWVVWPLAFVLAMLFLGPDNYIINHGRYVSPAIPFHALLAAVGVGVVSTAAQRIVRRVGRLQWARWVIPAALGVLLVTVVFERGRYVRDAVANDVHQLVAMHVMAGEFLRDHTAPDETIALNDVGAITHISDRRVLDMMGLVSPQVLDAIADTDRFTCPHDLQLVRVMLNDPPALIAIFPWFYPCLSSWQGALQAFTQFTITGPTVIAGGELIVYWPVWENWPVQRAVPQEAQTLDVSFEQGITLQAYELTRVESGLAITLWWRSNAQPRGDFTVFAHLIDADDAIISQSDSRPQKGQFNTLWWRRGDIIKDPRLIVVGEQALQDAVALRIGLYPTDGVGRLPRVPAPIDQPDFVIVPLP